MILAITAFFTNRAILNDELYDPTNLGYTIPKVFHFNIQKNEYDIFGGGGGETITDWCDNNVQGPN